MAPGALAQVLRPLASLFEGERHPDLLRGLEAPDDGAVWRLDGERALILTADFFPPVVDDPADFGAIAAANALSDVWAMGGRPLIAINLVGFPDDLDPEILSEVLRGGAETVRRAGAVLVGGHTTTDAEPKYGLAVVGEVHPQRVWSNDGARPGDTLLLTKPLGTGLLTTAARKQAADPKALQQAVDSMRRLHAETHRILEQQGDAVHGVTDITGFGLVGHAHEMANGSELSLRFDIARLPLLPGAMECVHAGHVPGGTRRNRDYFGMHCVPQEPREGWAEILFDPQTSGGLLVAAAPEAAARILEACRAAGQTCWEVGAAVAGHPGRIELIDNSASTS